MKKEVMSEGQYHLGHLCRKVDIKLKERYEFCQYVIDPNRFRLRKVVRILALVMLFIRNLCKRVKSLQITIRPDPKGSIHLPSELRDEQYLVTSGDVYSVKNNAGEVTEFKCKPGIVINLTDVDIQVALDYFYRKSTLEIKHFSDKKVYEKISEEKDGILYYTGRILPSQQFGGNLSLTDVMIDLTTSTFIVPIVDHFSPLAFSIVNEVHWYHPVAKHSGNETVLRYTWKYAHIIEGRDLVKF